MRRTAFLAARLPSLLLLGCCLVMLGTRGVAATYGPWDANDDLNEQHKGLLRFILSGDTAFWSRPEVATRIGFGTAPWRCVDRCTAQYYASAADCAPDCEDQTYCTPGGGARGDENTTCCALSLLDQSYDISQPPSATEPAWCSTYPSWGSAVRPSVCDFNAFTARNAQPPDGADDVNLAVSCSRLDVPTYSITGTRYRTDTAARIMYNNEVAQAAATTKNVVTRM
ncbi:hypothetical protein TSOC_012687 [Tetrabaena socialis]|uniref:Pherophorin domain-containing protein n=1 Tax=Tetrabaena socialis TaxID=47790 RepID=A0A2J7ZMD1_9CHLO|nr:hypothetical protein TSOC_012687 [Tetrabaena socialis]|eukprot:PNH01426.1 hypothetical protein TSOC_012687 [Tetrabaena socialis]